MNFPSKVTCHHESKISININRLYKVISHIIRMHVLSSMLAFLFRPGLKFRFELKLKSFLLCYVVALYHSQSTFHKNINYLQLQVFLQIAFIAKFSLFLVYFILLSLLISAPSIYLLHTPKCLYFP